VPLTLEGPTRTTRGVPPRCRWLSRQRRDSREAVGLVFAAGRGTGADTAGAACGRSRSVTGVTAAAP
jgi:hypothetical protein